MKKIWIVTLLLAFLGWGFGFTSPKETTNTKDTEDFLVFLKVKVLDEKGNPVQGAKVDLYETRSDYDNRRNVRSTEYTNKNGKTTFKNHLQRKEEYYVHVEKNGKTNNRGQVKTDELHRVSSNKETIVIY